MGQVSLFRLLLTPSLLSGFLVFIIAVLLLGFSGWSYISQGQFFYDYLFGPFGLVTALLYAPDFFAAIRINIINKPFTYNALILICAVLSGLLVYGLLESVRRVASTTSVVWYEFRSNNSQANAAVRETLVRLIVRSVSFVCLAVYTLLFFNLLLPFCVLLLRTGIDNFTDSLSWGLTACALSVLFLTVSLHLHVVLIRLTMLRPRLFGGWAS